MSTPSSDGWSMGVLVRELSALYAASARGPSPLAALPIQYGDFALWQGAGSRAAPREPARYWRRRSRGARVDRPPDRPARRRAFAARESRTLRLSSSLWSPEALETRGATPFMTLLAASRRSSRGSGPDDLVVGTPIANRNRSEMRT